jgi:hypothetical protein
MRKLLFVSLVATMVGAAPLRAQDVGAQVGAGFLLSETAGVAGTLALDLTAGSFYGRAMGQVMSTGESASWEGSIRVVQGTLEAGWMSASGSRPYVVGLVGSGFDWREGDDYWAFGGAAGVELGRISGEVRYERWDQHGPRHVDLPEDLLAAYVAVRLF